LFSSTHTTPANWPFSTMALDGAMWLPYLSVMDESAFLKLAFSRSIWLMTIMRAVCALSQAAHAFSAPTLRPETAPHGDDGALAHRQRATSSPAKSK
jgi:hypothetical protein